MTFAISMLVVFGFLAMATIFWGQGRIRRIEYGRMPIVVGEMMSRLGLTPRDAESAGLDRAVVAAGERCRKCEVGSQCRDWLASSFSSDAPGRHCPNAFLFDEIRRLRRPESPVERPRNAGLV